MLKRHQHTVNMLEHSIIDIKWKISLCGLFVPAKNNFQMSVSFCLCMQNCI